MGNLGAFFPPDARDDFVSRHLRPGQVLYLDCHFTAPPKEKYLFRPCPLKQVHAGVAILPMAP